MGRMQHSSSMPFVLQCSLGISPDSRLRNRILYSCRSAF